MKLVFIDVDGTLLKTRRSETLFAIELLNCGAIGKLQIAAYFKFYLKWFASFGFTIAKKNKAYLFGLEKNLVARLADQYVQKRLKYYVRLDLYERIQAHHRSGHQIVLLTGTLDCIARPLAERLGIFFVKASQCAMKNGYFTADPPLCHPYGLEKLRIAKEISIRFNTRLSDSIVYADSRADLPLLMAVSHPVAVAPDSKIARIARQKGWEVLR